MTNSTALGHGAAHPVRTTDKTVWLADFTYTQMQVAAELVPYAIGLVSTYAESRISFPQRIRLFKYPEKMAEAFASEGVPDVVGLSNYVWNSALSLAFARRIKEMRPDTVVVLGGPNYPVTESERADFLRAHPEIDFYVWMEGEEAFTLLMEALIDSGWDKEAVKGRVPSIHCVSAGGTVHMPPTCDRIKDLTVIPSPYLDGRLDEFFDGALLPIIQLRRGCPFTCAFCVEGDRYFSKINANSMDKIRAEIEYITERMREVRGKGGRNDIYIADSNFGMYPGDMDLARLIAELRETHGYPDYVHTATGKNQKERVLAIARMLKGALRLSGSVQTLDPEALKNIKRQNISADDLVRLALDAADADANSYSELILGLPGETLQSHYDTLRTVMEAGFNRVIVYQLMMLPGSELATTETKAQFGMQLRYRVLPRCFGAYEVGGKPTVVAEIEEICVANQALSFDDYIEARRLHMMISIFYNDGVFSTLVKFLKVVGGSVYRWTELLCAVGADGAMGNLLAEFEAATRSELWINRQDVEAFVQQPGVIERYIKGELGYNLMLTYKARAMAAHIVQLRDMAHKAAATLLAEIGKASAVNRAFLDEAVLYDSCRSSNIWSDLDLDVEEQFSFDMPRFCEEHPPKPVDSYLLAKPVRQVFALTADQKQVVRRNLALFGDDINGVARTLSKVYTKRLLRQPRLADTAAAPLAS